MPGENTESGGKSIKLRTKLTTKIVIREPLKIGIWRETVSAGLPGHPVMQAEGGMIFFSAQFNCGKELPLTVPEGASRVAMCPSACALARQYPDERGIFIVINHRTLFNLLEPPDTTEHVKNREHAISFPDHHFLRNFLDFCYSFRPVG
jgi:hypothetical protein